MVELNGGWMLRAPTATEDAGAILAELQRLRRRRLAVLRELNRRRAKPVAEIVVD